MSDATARKLTPSAVDSAGRVREHLKTQYPGHVPPVPLKVSPASFIGYYLNQARRIAQFAAKTGLIRFSLLRLRMSLVPNFRKYLLETYLTHCLPAYVCTEEIIRDGWKWQVLSVREYNHLVWFADFCRRVQVLERAGVVGVARGAQFKSMEDAFLAIVCRSDYIDAIASALRKALASQRTRARRTEEEQINIVSGLTCFFTAGCLKPCYHDLILARAMVSTRRHLTWSDILTPDTADFVQEIYYDCPPDVLGDMVEQLRDVEKQIDELKEERERIGWIRDVRGTGQDEPAKILSTYYTALGKSWNGDGADVLNLALSLAGHLTAGIDGLASGAWQVMSKAERVVRTPVIRDEGLRKTVQRLRSEHDGAVQVFRLTVPTKAPLADFVAHGSSAAQVEVGGRRAVFTKVTGILSDLYQVAQSLKRVRDDSAEGYGPGFYLSQMVVSPTSWRGKSLYDVLTRYIVLVVHACVLFRIRSLEQDQARLDEIDKRAATLEAARRNLDPAGALGGALRELGLR